MTKISKSKYLVHSDRPYVAAYIYDDSTYAAFSPLVDEITLMNGAKARELLNDYIEKNGLRRVLSYTPDEFVAVPKKDRLYKGWTIENEEIVYCDGSSKQRFLKEIIPYTYYAEIIFNRYMDFMPESVCKEAVKICLDYLPEGTDDMTFISYYIPIHKIYTNEDLMVKLALKHHLSIIQAQEQVQKAIEIQQEPIVLKLNQVEKYDYEIVYYSVEPVNLFINHLVYFSMCPFLDINKPIIELGFEFKEILGRKLRKVDKEYKLLEYKKDIEYLLNHPDKDRLYFYVDETMSIMMIENGILHNIAHYVAPEYAVADFLCEKNNYSKVNFNKCTDEDLIGMVGAFLKSNNKLVSIIDILAYYIPVYRIFYQKNPIDDIIKEIRYGYKFDD